MPGNKLMLETFYEDDYKLIAIHCSTEAYKLAFLLNKYLEIKLARAQTDVDYTYKNCIALYPLYTYYNKAADCDYYLVANKYKTKPEFDENSHSLFQENATYKTNLVPEHKTVDYFLKIEDSSDVISSKKILTSLNTINQIITAYTIDVSTLKSNENLIFD